MDYLDWDSLSINARKYIAEKDAQIASLTKELDVWKGQYGKVLADNTSLKSTIKRIEGVLSGERIANITPILLDDIDEALSICREVKCK